MEGGAQDAFRPAEEPLRATQDVSMTLTPMPSPDMDPADRRQPEQARRPLSVATDNMMLEFYKKDGYDLVPLLQQWENWFGGGCSEENQN